MIRRLCSISGTALAAVILALLFALPFPAGAFDLEERVHKTTLPNGIRLLVLERSISPTVSLYIRHRAGAIDEDSGRTGAAHFLEHMMFKGTTTIGTRDYEAEEALRREIDDLRAQLKGAVNDDGVDSETARSLSQRIEELEEEKQALIITNEIDRLYRERGALGLNAGTGYDLTSYMVHIPSNALELWARIESDRLLNPVFREFLPERDVVLEERRQVVESLPDRQLMELFLGMVYTAHPYGRPILGWSADIVRLDRDYLTRFFKSCYQPSDMVIAVVGDVSTPEVVSLVASYFGAIAPTEHQDPLARHITPEPPQRGERRAVLVSDANPRIMVGFRKPPAPHHDDYVLDLVNTLLSKGRSSRLYRSLVTEQGLASSVSVSNGFPGGLHENLFLVTAEPLAGVSLEELEEAIHAELDRLKTEPVPEKEIEKARNQTGTDFFRGLNSNSGLASVLSYYEAILGDYRYIATYVDYMESIDADDIMKAARTYFTKNNRTVAVLEREEKK